MSSWKKSFEGVLWKSRFVVILAVITSVLAGLDLFFVVGLESFRVLVSLAHSADLSLAVDERDRLLRESILRMISLIDGYLLGAFMFIFGFGLYELFLADLQEARASQTSGRILQIKSLEDLKTRLGRVILIILIVEIFKDAYEVKARSPLDLLYIAATIALIGLALYLTQTPEAQKEKPDQGSQVAESSKRASGDPQAS